MNFSFEQLSNAVSALRVVRFQMNKLELALNIDAAMGAARDYFERVMREVHAKTPGSSPHSARGVLHHPSPPPLLSRDLSLHPQRGRAQTA